MRAELAQRAAEREPSKLSLTDPAIEQRLHELLARHITSDRIEAILHTPAPGLDGMTLLEYGGLNGVPAAAAKIEQMFDWSQANGA
ncbi:MAG: hypothetical protein KG028_10335 [Actinobacteria bacterium]|nr:hypothetical protein [Actinomycetota bacterium]